MTEKLYTLSDLVEVLNSTKTKVHYWSQNAKEHYVEPDFVAGRGNAHGNCLIKLWSEGQLEELIEKFRKYEAAKEERRQDRIKTDNVQRKQRAEQQRRYRANAKKEGKEPPKQTKKKNKIAPMPIERPTLIYRPLSPEAQAAVDNYEAEFDKEQEEKAFQWLLSQGQ